MGVQGPALLQTPHPRNPDQRQGSNEVRKKGKLQIQRQDPLLDSHGIHHLHHHRSCSRMSAPPCRRRPLLNLDLDPVHIGILLDEHRHHQGRTSSVLRLVGRILLQMRYVQHRRKRPVHVRRNADTGLRSQLPSPLVRIHLSCSDRRCFDRFHPGIA